MRLRLVLSFALIVMVSVTLVAILARQGTAREVRLFMFGSGMTSNTGWVTVLEDYYRQNGSWSGVKELLSTRGHGMMGQGQGMVNQHLRIADKTGLVVADTGNPTTGDQLSKIELSNAIILRNGFRKIGYLLVEGGMGYSLNDELNLISRLNRAALTAGLIAGGLSLLLALLLAYSLLRPVRDLTAAARRLAQGDLTQRVEASGDDELATLGRTFNHMADSLQQAEESRRALTADIAHELRTPLAVQRANLEAMQDGIYPLTAENLQPVIEQTQLLTHLVEDLRTLALADAGQLSLERVSTDLPALVARVVERFQPHVTAHTITLNLESELANGHSINKLDNLSGIPPTQLLDLSDVLPPLDPFRIEQILNNLLSNALRHTPPGGQISLNLSRQVNSVELTVRDTGPGIPVEALPQVFERFYRADKSRSRAEGGSGLGLAIARHLARAHGGDLTAANHPQGGAVFTLKLPLV